jgi:hypothetical protein
MDNLIISEEYQKIGNVTLCHLSLKSNIHVVGLFIVDENIYDFETCKKFAKKDAMHRLERLKSYTSCYDTISGIYNADLENLKLFNV